MVQIRKLFMKQAMMRKVLISLLPILLFSVYLFGWRVLTLLAVVQIAGLLSEYGIMRLINGRSARISEAVLVTGMLFTLTLPPAVPYWAAVVGIVFGVVFGKGVFGGFGRNIFNPALVGRCFIYVSFPAFMTMGWRAPFSGLPGGFAHWQQDVVASATPIVQMRSADAGVGYGSLFFGQIAGSLGETSALLILLAAFYLILTKTASWKLMVSTLVSAGVLSTVLYLTGSITADPLQSLLSGGLLFAAVFMVTDPISAPAQDRAKIIYGILVGLVAVVIRTFSLFAEGIMFAILIVNTFVPLIERQLKSWQNRKKVSA